MWIEIDNVVSIITPDMSLPARGVWIEMLADTCKTHNQTMSLPARGVWIEIGFEEPLRGCQLVTPREGSVDGNDVLASIAAAHGGSLPYLPT